MGSRASYAARYASQYVYGFEDMLDPDLLETDGPLVDDFTVRGELSGKKAAIAISDNAFVKNIHIGTGATTTRSRRSSTGRSCPTRVWRVSMTETTS